MRYGKGWKPNVVPFSHTFSGTHQISRTGFISSTGVDLVQFTAPVMDQGQTSGCTGHGESDGAYTSFAAAGKPLPFVPSQLDPYKLARAIARARAGFDPATNPLRDEGAYPSDVVEAFAKWGLRAMGALAIENGVSRFSDVTLTNVNDEPALEELEADVKYIVEAHAITSHGAALVYDVQVALTGRMATPYGTFVDTAFEEWTPTKGFIGAPVNPRDPNGGGHFTDLVGFTFAGLLAQQGAAALPKRMQPNAVMGRALAQAASKLPATDPLFFGKNSWSKDWGLNGFYICTQERLLAPQSGDANAVVPVIRKAT